MSDATSSAASFSSFSSSCFTLTTVIVCEFPQLISPLQVQKADNEIWAEKQLERAAEQGCDVEKLHFIILSTESGTGDTSTGMAIVSAFMAHP